MLEVSDTGQAGVELTAANIQRAYRRITEATIRESPEILEQQQHANQLLLNLMDTLDDDAKAKLILSLWRDSEYRL